MKKRRKCSHYYRLWAGLLILIFSLSTAHSIDNRVYENTLFPSESEELLFDIDEVLFEGNENFEDAELASIITVYPSRNILHNALLYFYNNFRDIEAAPQPLLGNMSDIISGFSHEVVFFNENEVKQNVKSLETFYNINGFHDAEVYFTFLGDSVWRKNVLIFHIYEGERYRLQSLEYLGLDDIPENVRDKIEEVKKIKGGQYFVEDKIFQEINSIRNVLHNNGYYFASYEAPPVVISDSANHRDSIIVLFKPGKRYRIGEIKFTDRLNDQKKLQTKMKRQQMAIEPGDWYSRRKVGRSEDNLRYLGLFEQVTIDTIQREGEMPDSTLDFELLLMYRKQKEWNVGFFVNQTAYDDYINVGTEVEFIHRNIFSKAQTFNPYARFALKNMQKAIGNFNDYIDNPEFEFKVGLNYGQPLIWAIGESRVGFYSNISWTREKVNQFFEVSTVTLPFKFPVQQPGITYFNNLYFDFTFERQEPLDFDDNLNAAYELAKTARDTAQINEAVLIYSKLDDYLLTKDDNLNPAFTANLIGFSMVGDHRNDLFSPTQGDFAQLDFDFWNFLMPIPTISGIAKFLRTQFSYYRFFPVSGNSTLALKGRLGAIYLFDPQNSYVPLERQFFAGGANSIRGWAPRELRYTKFDAQEDSTSDQAYRFLQQNVGNAGLVELTAELRYSFQRPRNWSKFWADQWANLGLAAFLDAGNAFGWFVQNEYRRINLGDLYHLAVSAGVGLRYKTPVGPVRIDFAWPLYVPPNTVVDPGIKIHFGLGNPF